MQLSPRLLVDVGNTRCHFAVARGTRILARHDVPHGQGPSAWWACLQRLEPSVGRTDGPSPPPEDPGSDAADDPSRAGAAADVPIAGPGLDGLAGACVASVDPERGQDLAGFLGREVGLDVCSIEGAEDIPLVVGVEQPESVGVDRLLNALAARRRAPGAHLILDFGSALTVDLVDAGGVFRGGAIAPGLGTLSRGLADATARLPRVTITKEPPILGRSTLDAIRAGLFHGLVGAARYLLAGLLEEAGEASVWATGGDARLLAPHVVGIGRVCPDLTLIGLALATLPDVGASG